MRLRWAFCGCRNCGAAGGRATHLVDVVFTSATYSHQQERPLASNEILKKLKKSN